ncbi:MAG: hypothetical protein J6S50_01145 [Oscillospiraceae bacterium]|nr:hypothetical protein [Oscillospiraceae bacterium]
MLIIAQIVGIYQYSQKEKHPVLHHIVSIRDGFIRLTIMSRGCITVEW